ncbi:Do family serine endopeptidase [Thiothrix subterranea]|uniref:Do family serine endopeptidase n=1 Tax=Thiothrix subterranea TaxID=2735563 RepID=UPI001D194359|nr:Do family serine endopeptidase [Thiothrix subterranea]
MAAFILPIAVPSTVCAALPTEVNGQALPSLATMLEKITPAVVNIATEGRQPINDSLLNDPFFKRFFGDTPPGERQINGTGSGVIIHAQRGHILTNSHVVESADAIHVTLKDGRKYLAEVVGIDPRADLAVLQIPAERLTAMRFGDSDRLRVGDFVVAIGNPYSIGQTVTSGIISALHRNPGISEYENFIQTDAPINLGNSGGPLVNLSGELIGINTAILGDQGGGNLGIGFAVPINTAAGVITQIVQYGSVERGQLGVEVQDVDSTMARDFGIKPNEGAIINQVLAGSPAEKAGVEAGDIIIKMNNKNVQGAVDVKNIIGDLRVGTEVNMTLLRAGRPRNITVIIAQPKTEKSAAPLRADNLQKATGQPFWEKSLR